MSVPSFDTPAIHGSARSGAPRAPSRIKIAIPATAQGPDTPVTIGPGQRRGGRRLLEVLGPLWLDVGRGPGGGGPVALQPRRPTGFLSVPIPSIVMLTTSPGASAQASGTRMPVPVESTVPGGTGL
jgi:hypothetical protein